MNTWKQKLSSRKFWAALAAAVGAMAVALCGEQFTPEMVTALKCATTALIAYVFGEGAVDVARIIAQALSSSTSAASEEALTDKAEADR